MKGSRSPGTGLLPFGVSRPLVFPFAQLGMCSSCSFSLQFWCNSQLVRSLWCSWPLSTWRIPLPVIQRTTELVRLGWFVSASVAAFACGADYTRADQLSLREALRSWFLRPRFGGELEIHEPFSCLVFFYFFAICPMFCQSSGIPLEFQYHSHGTYFQVTWDYSPANSILSIRLKSQGSNISCRVVNILPTLLTLPSIVFSARTKP